MRLRVNNGLRGTSGQTSCGMIGGGGQGPVVAGINLSVKEPKSSNTKRNKRPSIPVKHFIKKREK